MKIDIVILAAGQGTRMKSLLPKVLHPLGGKPLLQHVINMAETIPNSNITVVSGYGSEQIQNSIAGKDLKYVYQAEQLGTANAVQTAAPNLDSNGITLVLYGDVPLISSKTVLSTLKVVNNNTMGLLTVVLENPEGYGRIVRDREGDICGIIEQKDATSQDLKIQEVNTGVMAIRTNLLQKWLLQIGNDNAQNEYYLTDIISIADTAGIKIKAVNPGTPEEVKGVNTRKQLSKLERFYQQKQADKLMENGATLADPTRVDIRGTVFCDADTFIDVNTVFEGEVKLGKNVSVGPNCFILGSSIGDNVKIKANTIIENSTICNGVEVGPFARVRPGTLLSDNSKIGNFVEVKNTEVGKGSKISHLSYVGDSQLGKDVNVGAGTITCNYDGANKNKTIIGDDSFIGSNTSLVAPLTIGKNATIGAGSTIIKDIPDNELSVSRSPQLNKSGWVRPKKKK
jgi:bifunctional UDP-N-acetylglucosamine pyrophosphorylase/glucosamine-1-phosphate N-acetyltransferase